MLSVSQHDCQWPGPVGLEVLLHVSPLLDPAFGNKDTAHDTISVGHCECATPNKSYLDEGLFAP